MDEDVCAEGFHGLEQASLDGKIRFLKNVKNNIVGQTHRKEAAIRNGILDHLVPILSGQGSSGKRPRVDTAKVRQSQEWTTEDELRLQAAVIVGSLAAGGQSFMAPLCAAGVPATLAELLSDDASSKVITAVLVVLRTMAVCLASAHVTSENEEFWPAIMTPRTVEVFDTILRRSRNAAARPASLVITMISSVPAAGKALAVQSGILDSLTSLLIIQARVEGIYPICRSIRSAQPQSSLGGLLNALSHIIGDSVYRAHRFIFSQPVRDLLGYRVSEIVESQASLGPKYGMVVADESQLPPVHFTAQSTVLSQQSSFFPAIQYVSFASNSGAMDQHDNQAPSIEHVNAVCSWLLVLARESRTIDQLAALMLLACVTSSIDDEPTDTSDRRQKTWERQRQLALQAVPLAVKMVVMANEVKSGGSAEGRIIQQQACAILARLIKRDKELQIAAVQGGAIKHVCALLKKSFDHAAVRVQPWSAIKFPPVAHDTPRSRVLGALVLPPSVLHAMQCRKGALDAIAALAAREDIHRKAIIDGGAVTCIIDSAVPHDSYIPANIAASDSYVSIKDGNTAEVVLAACNAAQSMSRSVTVLRTSLIDAGLAKPIIKLLQHPLVEVQVAATDVCCNLSPDFSPLREDITQLNVITTLVTHARSSQPQLRISSLWTLKHLMCACPKEFKLATLEELGIGWLVGILQGSSQDSALIGGNGGVNISLNSANAAGEQVDLLNPSSMDLDEPNMPQADKMYDDEDDGEVMYDEASSTHYQSSHLRSTLAAQISTFDMSRHLNTLWNMENSQEYAARWHETMIQVQALDFIRNIMNGEDSVALIDHVLLQVGQNKFWEILTSKLAPLVHASIARAAVYQSTDLVLSVIHVLTHVSCASTRHRAMLVAQRALLRALVPHAGHVEGRVRAMFAWVVVNLTHVEDEDDRTEAAGRWRTLKELGFERATRAMVNDVNKDVLQRVRTCLRNFEKLG